ncbi:MAG: DUF2490 domain-containing protein [Bacteroidia bacterium]|nr:DUF2490 domain-containing protein [Bacteroidia bacterium]
MKALKAAIVGILFIWSLNSFADLRDFGYPCFHCQPISYDDSGFLLETSFSKKLSKVFKGEVNLQTRYMNRFSQLKGLMPEIGFSAKINKHFSIKTCYRYNLVWSTGSRVLIAGYYKWKKKGFPLNIQFRTRLETGDGDFWRNRIKTEFNMSKIVDPYSSFETFYRLFTDGFINIIRYEGGLKWRLKKSVYLNTIYRFEKIYDNYSRSYRHYYTTYNHIVGISLGISL